MARHRQRSFEARKDTILSKLRDLAILTGAEVFLEIKCGNTITRLGSPCRQAPGMVEQNLRIEDLTVRSVNSTPPPAWSFSSPKAGHSLQQMSMVPVSSQSSTSSSSKRGASILANLCCASLSQSHSGPSSPAARSNPVYAFFRPRMSTPTPSRPQVPKRGVYSFKCNKTLRPMRPPSPHHSVLREQRSAHRNASPSANTLPFVATAVPNLYSYDFFRNRQ